MSVMLYPCMLCVALLMCLFVLCVACLTVFVNCLVKQFAMCLGVVAILLLNVMDVFSVCGGALLDSYLLNSTELVSLYIGYWTLNNYYYYYYYRPCMVFQRVCVLCL